ncbi:probable aldo-keto reductase 1 [Medicago truncatula]|uniref:probable aldo-keto reductase 1 n=1 Tax=Medicago truncatula TaxID=3880 RepID=UPI000D2F1F13|nr:probable aldo-keto reductase 1 [Medicago truncatula]
MHYCSISISMVLQQGKDVVPIPGTTKIENLDQNLGALGVKLSEEDMREISDAVPEDDIAGSRYYNGMDSLSWKFANTPPKVSTVST